MNTISAKRIARQVNVARMLSRHGEILVFLLLLVLGGAAGIALPQFLTGRNISNILRQASALGIVCVGQTCVILAHGIDLSVGAVITLVNCLCAMTMQGRPEMVLPAVLVALVVGLVVGFFNGTMVTRFGLADFVVTLAVMSIANGAMFVMTEGREVGAIAPGFMYLSEGNIGPLPTSLVPWLVMTAVAAVFLKYTRTGRHIYAVGGDPDVARLSGIDGARVKRLVYVLSGLSAAVAAIVLTSRLWVGDPTSGVPFQLDSIAAVVIGGTSLAGGRGGVVGTIAGVLVVSVLSNIFNLAGVSAFAQYVLKGLVIVAVVVVRAMGERKK